MDLKVKKAESRETTPIKICKRESRKKLKKILRRFCERTSMQGVPYIQSSGRPIAKVFWSVLSLTAIGFLSLHMYSLVTVFYENGKHTTVKVGFDRLRFPAVTICNVNPVRKSKLELTTPKFREFVSKINPENRLKEIQDFLQQENGTSGTHSIGTFLNYSFSHYRDNATDMSLVALIHAEFKHLYGQMGIFQRLRAGHQIHTMLFDCHFSGKQCRPVNFTVSTNVDYGNCFTVQSHDYVSARSGPSGGLQLILFLQTHEYLPGYTNSKGLVASIHTTDTYPFPQEDGIALSAGMESFVGMKMMRIERLSEPYGNCRKNTDYFSDAPLTYTRRFCQSRCREELVTNSCGCYDAEQIDIIFFFGWHQSFNRCQTWDELRCLKNISRSWINGKLECPCPSECYEEYLEFSLSARPWPSDSYLNLLVSDACLKVSKTDCDRIRELERDNFIKVNIFYADLNYQNITEVPAYGVSKFVSDIGGTAGLWIGVSILSFFEIIQLFSELFMYCLQGHWEFLAMKFRLGRKKPRAQLNVYVIDELGQSREIHVSQSNSKLCHTEE